MKTQRSERTFETSSPRRLTAIVLIGFVLLSAFLSGCSGRDSSIAGSSTGSSTSPSFTPSSTSSSTPSVTPASWHRIAPAPIDFDYFTPAAAVWDGHEMLLVVTHNSATGNCDETVLAYDPSADSWRTLSRVPKPKGCFEGSDKAVWTGHELLLSGISNVAYDPAADTWRHLPEPSIDAGSPLVVWTGTQMIGWGGGCCDQELADGVAYTLATNSSKALPPSPLLGRHAAGAWTGKELIIAGGAGYDPPSTEVGWQFVHFSDAAAYDPATRTWRKLPSMPVARGGGYYTLDYAAIWDGTELLVIGGTSHPSMKAKPLARSVAYDPATNSWRWTASMEFPRNGFASAWAGDQLVVWGGTNVDGSIPSHGEAYDPTSDTWSALPKAPIGARTDAIAVWTGTELIIWGGTDARTGERLFDGAAFSPASG